jgi:CheY-like chemotaxis protein
VDLRMPTMDGFETAVRLLTILGPHVRLLAITGELTEAADPRTAAFERVLTKPLDMPELLRAVADKPPGVVLIPTPRGHTPESRHEA